MSATRSVRRRLWLLLLLTLAPVAVSPAAAATGDAPPSVYRVADPFYREVQALDPVTLADVGPPVSLAADGPRDSSFHLSADGSTTVTGHFSIEGIDWTLNLQVSDASTGAQRAELGVSGRDAHVLALSRDGGRMVVSTKEYDKRARLYATVWTVHDTRSGDPLSRFGLTHRDGEWFTAYVDDAAEHMWLRSSTVDEPNYSTEARMGSLVLRHVDLRQGREAARLTLGSVEIGTVERGGDDELPVFERVDPAIALGPDGRTLAIVELATEEVVLIDGMSMSRIRSFAVREPESLTRRLLGWTGLLAEAVGAKFQVGEWRGVAFSADGESIYLTGGRGEIAGDAFEDYEAEWLGVRRVDLGTGEVEAVALDGHQVDRILTTAGGDLYLLGPDRPWTEVNTHPSGTVLRRVDPQTLSVEATRHLDGTVWTVLVTEASEA